MCQATVRMVAALALGLLVGACGSSADAPTPGTGAPQTAPTTSVPASVRSIDFTGAPYAADLINRAGGGDVSRERVRYVDLTGDGIEEAVVVVESGGTLGDTGVGIFKEAASGADLAYFRKLGGRVDTRGSALVLIEGAPAPTDPACCPAQLRESTVEWRGSAFEVTSERLVANPGGSGGAPGY